MRFSLFGIATILLGMGITPLLADLLGEAFNFFPAFAFFGGMFLGKANEKLNKERRVKDADKRDSG